MKTPEKTNDGGDLDSPLREKEKGEFARRLKRFVREVVAIGFWIYGLIKVFVFDIDLTLFNWAFPEFDSILKFKFLILIGLVAILWVVTNTNTLVGWLLYIIFYPVILLCWKIPYFIFRQKSWNFALAVVNAVITFFKSLKYNFISGAAFLICLAIVLLSSNAGLLGCAIGALLYLILQTYINRFLAVFKPSSVFGLYKRFFSWMRKTAQPQFTLGEEMRQLPIERLSEKQLEKRSTNLQTSVLFNRFCLFTARKLRDFQNSRLNIISDVVTLLIVFVFTVITCAGIDFAIYKIDVSTFKTQVSVGFFDFCYYSFNHLVLNSISEISPVAPISQLLAMFESFLSVLLLVILVSLVISVKNQKYVEELNTAIRDIEAEGTSMEGFIKDEYRLGSLDDALSELGKVGTSMLKLIDYLSKEGGA